MRARLRHLCPGFLDAPFLRECVRSGQSIRSATVRERFFSVRDDRFLTGGARKELRTQALRETDVTWVLGPAEIDGQRSDASAIQQRAEVTGEHLLIQPALQALAERIAEADLYIGNDAGITHVAAAVGTPTIAIFGPTDPQVWRPLGDHVTVVATPEPGRAIEEVTVEQVAASVESVSSHRRRSAAPSG